MERHIRTVIQILAIVGGAVSIPDRRFIEKIYADNELPQSPEEKPILPPEFFENGVSLKRGGDMKVLREVMEKANAEKRIPHEKLHGMNIPDMREYGKVKLREVSMRSDKSEQEKRENNIERMITNERNELKNAKRNLEQREYTMEQAKALDIKGKSRQTNMDKDQATKTLAEHQMYRSQEPASNMWHIRWSEDLANLAQGLADTCVFKHTNLQFENGTYVGQNLGAVIGPDTSMEYILKLFYNERKDYDIVNHRWNDATIVGHYLLMVNWETSLVGCGKKLCNKLQVTPIEEVWENAMYYVCDYWPPANWKQRPYEMGEHCSRCIMPEVEGMGFQCKDDGCAECKLDEGNINCHKPIDCPRYNEDTSGHCPMVKTLGGCKKDSSYHEFAKMYCQTSCKVCAEVPKMYHTA